MKIIIAASLILLGMNAASANDDAQSETDLIHHAITEGYQTQRNLAFDYQTGSASKGGSDLIGLDMTKSCAWRKIILFANPEKTDSSDVSNERFSCSGLNFEQDNNVWKIVYQYIPMINAQKAKGTYMAQNDTPPSSGELGIIDVTP